MPETKDPNSPVAFLVYMLPHELEILDALADEIAAPRRGNRSATIRLAVAELIAKRKRNSRKSRSAS